MTTIPENRTKLVNKNQHPIDPKLYHLTRSQAKELINRRENQVLVHACLYYMYNANLISDDLYDKWSFELKALIDTYPAIFKDSYYYKEFRKFVPDSGYYLHYQVKQNRAHFLLEQYKKELKAKKKKHRKKGSSRQNQLKTSKLPKKTSKISSTKSTSKH